MDIVVHHELEWCDELERLFKEIQRNCGYFVTLGGRSTVTTNTQSQRDSQRVTTLPPKSP